MSMSQQRRSECENTSLPCVFGRPRRRSDGSRRDLIGLLSPCSRGGERGRAIVVVIGDTLQLKSLHIKLHHSAVPLLQPRH